MSQNLKFVTSVSSRSSKGLVLRNEKLSELINEADFVSTLYLSLVGRKPEKSEKVILNAILVSAIDHGISPASGFVPRAVASSGGNILMAMASSILSLGPKHGGSVSAAMEVYQQIIEESEDIEKSSENLVDQYRIENKRIPGFGHPVYKDQDPRAKVLFELARKNNLRIEYMNIAKQLEHTIEAKLNKKLVLNIDGAIAALLLSIGIKPKAGNAIFALAKVAGSIAHSIEEQEQDGGVRRVPEEDIEYVSK